MTALSAEQTFIQSVSAAAQRMTALSAHRSLARIPPTSAIARSGHSVPEPRTGTGANDENTNPVLAREYVALLKANGIEATYVEVPGVGHNDLVRAGEFTTIISQLLGALR